MASTGLTGETTVTQRLVDIAACYGSRPALISAGRADACSFAELATTILGAAAGLAWRGLRPRDIVAVHVPDAICYVLACHSVSAAGGIPCPVQAGLSVTDMAGQLADCGARMLLTAEPLAAAGLAAADRSWVRQVISFGDAPAATPFISLLGRSPLAPLPARPQDIALLAYHRRPGDVALTATAITNADRAADLDELAAEPVSDTDLVLVPEPTGDGRCYTALLDHVLLQGATALAAPAAELAAAAARHGATAAIVPPGITVPDARIRLLAVTS